MEAVEAEVEVEVEVAEVAVAEVVVAEVDGGRTHGGGRLDRRRMDLAACSAIFVPVRRPRRPLVAGISRQRVEAASIRVDDPDPRRPVVDLAAECDFRPVR